MVKRKRKKNTWYWKIKNVASFPFIPVPETDEVRGGEINSHLKRKAVLDNVHQKINRNQYDQVTIEST